jgi:hypothetical protein
LLLVKGGLPLKRETELRAWQQVQQEGGTADGAITMHLVWFR